MAPAHISIAINLHLQIDELSPLVPKYLSTCTTEIILDKYNKGLNEIQMVDCEFSDIMTKLRNIFFFSPVKI